MMWLVMVVENILLWQQKTLVAYGAIRFLKNESFIFGVKAEDSKFY